MLVEISLLYAFTHARTHARTHTHTGMASDLPLLQELPQKREAPSGQQVEAWTLHGTGTWERMGSMKARGHLIRMQMEFYWA